MLVRILAVTLALLSGCSGDDTHMMMPAPPDMGRTGPMDHPPLWRLSRGSAAVQAAPEIYIVVWPGDEAFGAEVVDFVDWMLHSDYWKTSLGEYGVGAGVAKGLIVMPTAAPTLIGDSTLQTIASQLVTSGQVTRTDNTQVAFIPPPTSKVTSGGSASCDAFLGYHQRTGGAGGVAYSITARCEGAPGSDLDQVTDTLSHEAAEAATDVSPGAGLIDISPVHQEVADLCEFGLDMPVDVPADATHPTARRYWVQRNYSDARAADGTIEPCLPIPWDHPYWNVAVDPPVIPAAPGSTAPIDARLDVFAYGDVGLIKWVASSSGADVEPSSGEAHAGDTIAISITPLSALRSGEVVEIDLLSESAKAGSQLWFGYVQGRLQ
jgi:hypothetical protein